MIDHLVYATTDLEKTVAEMADRLGVEPTPGGVHLGRGTRNELVSLGGSSSLEIVGPDRDQPDPPGGRPFGIDDLHRPRLIAWCARPEQPLKTAATSAFAQGWNVGPIAAMSRRRPDGVELAWELTMPQLGSTGVAILPFLIDWGSSPHPTETLTQPLRLVHLRIECRDPERVANQLASVGEAHSVEFLESSTTHLSALLQTPHGPLTFS
jgi:Glyoxalase-like domain